MTKTSPFPIPRPDSALPAVLLLALSALAWTGMAGQTSAGSAAKTSSSGRAVNARVPFIENRGQLATDVRYYAQMANGVVYVTGDGALVYALKPRGKETPGWALKETLRGAGKTIPHGIGDARRRARWLASVAADAPPDVPMPTVVRLGEVYPGIELDLKAFRSNVEKIFILRPGAVPATIAIDVSGAQHLKANRRGGLEMVTDIGTVRLAPPVAYQVRDGKREFVKVAYRTSGNSYGFDVGVYDRSRSLFIE